MNANQREAAESQINDVERESTEAADSPVAVKLIRLADALGFMPKGARLDVKIGTWLCGHADQESACFFFRRALDRCGALAENVSDIAYQARILLAIADVGAGGDSPARAIANGRQHLKAGSAPLVTSSAEEPALQTVSSACHAR